MAKIVKTKSGKYHTKVFCGFDARGKKIEKSITAPTIKEVKRLVALATIEEPRTTSPTCALSSIKPKLTENTDLQSNNRKRIGDTGTRHYRRISSKSAEHGNTSE